MSIRLSSQFVLLDSPPLLPPGTVAEAGFCSHSPGRRGCHCGRGRRSPDLSKVGPRQSDGTQDHC